MFSGRQVWQLNYLEMEQARIESEEAVVEEKAAEEEGGEVWKSYNRFKAFFAENKRQMAGVEAEAEAELTTNGKWLV